MGAKAPSAGTSSRGRRRYARTTFHSFSHRTPESEIAPRFRAKADVLNRICMIRFAGQSDMTVAWRAWPWQPRFKLGELHTVLCRPPKQHTPLNFVSFVGWMCPVTRCYVRWRTKTTAVWSGHRHSSVRWHT